MDVKMVTPFIDAFFNVLPQLGLQGIERGKLGLKDKLVATMDVTAVIGLSRSLRGNVTYSMSEKTAKTIASTMMMGMAVEHFDEMAQSAIAELSNMVTANAGIGYEEAGLAVDISPPTLIIGENVTARVSQVQTIAVEILTQAGVIEVNVGLEI